VLSNVDDQLPKVGIKDKRPQKVIASVVFQAEFFSSRSAALKLQLSKLLTIDFEMYIICSVLLKLIAI
jgi:hypothetical protein